MGGMRAGREAEVESNPQHLAPRHVFLAFMVHGVVQRAAAAAAMAPVTRRGAESSVLVIDGILSRSIDAWCGATPKLCWPFPNPHPDWLTPDLTATDLLV